MSWHQRTTRLATLSGILVCLSLPCLAQQVSKKLTNRDVTEMVSLGLSDDLIVDKIHAADATDFDTSIDALKALKASKVSDSIIRAMINPHALVPATSDQKQPSKTDPNDPESPHESGIYMYAKARDGLKMVLLEPTVYSQGKTGGVFKSVMTYGIAKAKYKAVVQGPSAALKSSDNDMVFYFYFEETGAGLSHSSGGTTTPNEFTLLKFDQTKDSRETVVMTANVFGASNGTDEKATIHFSSTKLRPGVYRVKPNAPLQPGEYCFLSSAGLGTFAAGSSGASRLFDFAVTTTE